MGRGFFGPCVEQREPRLVDGRGKCPKEGSHPSDLPRSKEASHPSDLPVKSPSAPESSHLSCPAPPQAELDTNEAWALRHCHQQANPPLLCAEIKDDVDRLRTQLSKLAAAGVSWDSLFLSQSLSSHPSIDP